MPEDVQDDRDRRALRARRSLLEGFCKLTRQSVRGTPITMVIVYRVHIRERERASELSGPIQSTLPRLAVR